MKSYTLASVLAAIGYGVTVALAASPPGDVPVLTPGTGWVGYQSTTQLGGGGTVYAPNTLLFVNGTAVDPATAPLTAWRYLPIANVSEPNRMNIDPLNNELVVTTYHGDPSGAWIKEVVVMDGYGHSITIPGSNFQIGVNNIPGYRFKLAQLAGQEALYGFYDVTFIVRPMNGYEKVFKRTYFLNHFNGYSRKVVYVAPASYTGAVSTTWAAAVAAGKTAPFATVQKACIAATLSGAGPSPIIKLLAGTHLQDDGGSAGANPTMVTIQADDGLTNSQVILDKSPASVLPYSGKGGTANIFSAVSLFKNLTQKWTNVGTFQNSGSPTDNYRATYWQNCPQIDDQGSNGPVRDIENTGIDNWSGYDPDEDGTSHTGHGGFGFFIRPGVTGATDATSLYNTNGTIWGFMECTGNFAGPRAANFLRNVDFICGFDATLPAGLTRGSRTKYDGSLALDSDDLFIMNAKINLRSQTPFKSRMHDACTLRVLQSQQFAATSCTFNGSAFTHPLGFTIVDFDPNSLGGQPVTMPAYNNSPGYEFYLRFMKGSLIGASDMTIEPNLGYRLVSIGAGTLVINGTTITLGANQCVFKAQFNAVLADRATITSAPHTDTIQYTGLSPELPCFDNHLVWNYQAWGPGAGNAFLLTTNTPCKECITVDTAGNFTMLSYPAVRAANTVVIDPASPPAAFDGVTLISGDRVLVRNVNNIADVNCGIYVFNGAGVPLTRTADALAYCGCVKILQGSTYAGSRWIVNTNATIDLGTTAVQFIIATLRQWDTITVKMPNTSIYEGSFIISLNSDGVSGKLSRPFLDPTDKTTPVAIAANTICQRGKPLANSAWVNCTFNALTTFGQMSGGHFNFHMAYTNLWTGLSLKSYEDLYAAEGVTFRGVAFGASGLGQAGTDVHKCFTLLDLVSKGTVSNVANVNFMDATSAVVESGLTLNDNGLGLSGTTRRLVAPAIVPFDINGNPRAIGSKIGVEAV